MKHYIIMDKSAKYCPYIGVAYANDMPMAIGMDHITKAKFWAIGDVAESKFDDSDAMLNLFKKGIEDGKKWEIREVTFLVGPPLTLPSVLCPP